MVRFLAGIYFWEIVFLGLLQKIFAEYTYQSYQRGITCTTKYLPCYPTSIQEIQNIVRYAQTKNTNVKPLGSKHSVSDSICTSGIPIFMDNITHFYYNPSTLTAKVGAGLQLGDLLEKLHQLGRTISGVPDYGGITVGGALGNGAHGTGLKYPSTISEQLISITLIDGRGNLRRITKENEHFPALRVNLGLLGVIYEVEIITETQYKLHVQHYPIGDGVLRNGTDFGKLARKHDHFQFWWFPTNRQIVLGIGTRVPVSVAGECSVRMNREMPSLTRAALSTSLEMFYAAQNDLALFNMQTLSMLSLYRDILVAEPQFVEPDDLTPCLNNIVGYSHKMVNNKCESCWWHEDLVGEDLNLDFAEFAIPIYKLMPALRSLGELFERRLTQFPIEGIRVRFLTAGDAFMGMNGEEKEWAAIGWTTIKRWDSSQPKVGIASFQAMSQILVHQYGARPHWGKNGLHYSSVRLIRHAYPSLDQFIAAMNEFDPQERFMNNFGERVKHGNDLFTVTDDMTEHCALSDLCICRKNVDCGNDGLLDYGCGQFPGFPKLKVCLPGILEQVREAYSRTVISVTATVENNEYTVLNYLQQFNVLGSLFGTGSRYRNLRESRINS